MRFARLESECATYTRKNNIDAQPQQEVDLDAYPLAKKPAGRLRVDLMKLNRIVKEAGDKPGAVSQEAFDMANSVRSDIVHELNRRVRTNGDIY